MRSVAIAVERFNNGCRHCIGCEPPRRGHWTHLSSLYSESLEAYGAFSSLHYRDLEAPATPVGWIFQEPGFTGTIETWVSCLDADTLRYVDIRTLDESEASHADSLEKSNAVDASGGPRQAPE